MYLVSIILGTYLGTVRREFYVDYLYYCLTMFYPKSKNIFVFIIHCLYKNHIMLNKALNYFSIQGDILHI